MLALIALYVFTAGLIGLFAGRKRVLAVMEWYCQAALRLLNVRVTVVEEGHGRENQRGQSRGGTGRFFVANHLGYLDALVVSSHMPVRFVTSIEMRELPLLGWLTRLAQSLYVERRERTNLSREEADITAGLKAGDDVMVFPEGTSTNGDTVLRFRTPLFQAAIDAVAVVSPLTINYLKVNGEPTNVRSREAVCWYGDRGFLSSLFELSCQNSVDVEIVMGEPIRAHLVGCKKILATASHAEVTRSFIPLHLSGVIR